MNILFDHQTFSLQTYGGISRYFRELIDGINQVPDYQADLSVMWSDNPYAQRPAPLPNFSFRGRGTFFYTSNQLYSRYRIRKNKFDVFHATYYDPYFLKDLTNRPFVITLHDMTHERLGHRFSELIIDRFTAGKHALARKAQAVIAVSQYTKQDAIDLLGLDPSKIHVVYHASSLKPIHITDTLCVDSYLLYVGNRGHYKNFKGLLMAITKLPKSLKLRVVCAGGGEFTMEEHTELARLGLTNQVVHQPFSSDAALAALYSSAIAFVFPSFYEGFGIPILEAFACGCPCIVSETSSLPEVAGEAALYIDPEQPDSITEAIETVICNASIRSSLVKKGFERLAYFSWLKTATKTIDVYHALNN